MKRNLFRSILLLFDLIEARFLVACDENWIFKINLANCLECVLQKNIVNLICESIIDINI